MARLIAERHDVVPALGEVFRRFGFEGASIARITAHTKLGKGSLYHFFPGGKDEMAEAVLGHIRDWFETEVFIPLMQEPPAQAIESMFASVEQYFHSGRRICLVGAFAMDETRDRFSKAVGGYFQRWIDALGSALSRAGMTEIEAENVATEVVGGIQGAIVLARALDDDQRFTVIIKGLAQRCRMD
ncbi:TetR/AcrR family transcriptional regulator [Rhizobium sp. FY34]|uniref:TetR/AcrR family transcriptional regulator n=1 Tax=Rhizobium sp. FY34 TaxID=2562309 RepID=UPI0010BFE2DF|nr:TetR/AcrR family transcriptional regulator [Rhizobium sp. FY34]